MKYFLVTFDDNWADEMDIEGFAVATEDQLELFKRDLMAANYPTEIYIGSNQSIGYNDFDDYWACVDHEEITLEEYNLISKLFSAKFETYNEEGVESSYPNAYGTFCSPIDY